MTEFGHLYLGNKMAGKPYFNAPWFDLAAYEMRQIPGVQNVFNPADEDRKYGFEPMKCPDGSEEEARTMGFDRRRSLETDWKWIAQSSSGLVIGPDWPESPGTISEIACHQALGLPVWESSNFFDRIAKGFSEDLFCKPWQFIQLTDLMV